MTQCDERDHITQWKAAKKKRQPLRWLLLGCKEDLGKRRHCHHGGAATIRLRDVCFSMHQRKRDPLGGGRNVVSRLGPRLRPASHPIVAWGRTAQQQQQQQQQGRPPGPPAAASLSVCLSLCVGAALGTGRVNEINRCVHAAYQACLGVRCPRVGARLAMAFPGLFSPGWCHIVPSGFFTTTREGHTEREPEKKRDPRNDTGTSSERVRNGSRFSVAPEITPPQCL